MAQYAMQWFVYEGDWHLCHLFHVCRPCHHDMEGGGDHRKVCRGTCCDMGKLLYKHHMKLDFARTRHLRCCSFMFPFFF